MAAYVYFLISCYRDRFDDASVAKVLCLAQPMLND